MKKPRLDQNIFYRLFEFAQDYIVASEDSGRERADKGAYQYVDTIHFEDIHLREIYTQFYEDEKARRNHRIGRDRTIGKLF